MDEKQDAAPHSPATRPQSMSALSTNRPDAHYVQLFVFHSFFSSGRTDAQLKEKRLGRPRLQKKQTL